MLEARNGAYDIWKNADANEDRDAAVKWLESVLAGRESNAQMQDIASRIGAVHSEDMVVQRMLARIYLEERRSDFAALKTYRLLVVAGMPATPMRQRFSDGVAERLMALAWWDWDHDRLHGALADFRGLKAEAFLEKYGG